MPKITFIGAGSTVFARNLLNDIFSFPELGESTISLFDIDKERLKTSEIVAQRGQSRRGQARRSRPPPTAATRSMAPIMRSG